MLLENPSSSLSLREQAEENELGKRKKHAHRIMGNNSRGEHAMSNFLLYQLA